MLLDLHPQGRLTVETASTPSAGPNRTFLERNEFFIRRLFSLCGLVPVGAYMVVHLLTNASLMSGPAAFQRAVYQIHSLGPILPIVEWAFIFIPIIFHAILGVVIIRGGLPNSGTYAYGSNVRYTLQRATGLIAFLFIFLHVFHMHGWFHFDWWLSSVAEPLGGAQFKPYNASSTTGAAFQKSILVPILYGIGVFSCIFHLANGIWSFGVRWGIWTSPKAQGRAAKACGAFGILLALASSGALVGPTRVDVKEARQVEKEMYEAKRAAHEVDENPHKLAPAASETPAVGETEAASAADSPEASGKADENKAG